MRSRIAIGIGIGMLVGGCKQVFELEGFAPPPDQPRPEEPFMERVIGATRAGTIVAVTRDSHTFPDVVVEYRLYLRGIRFAEGDVDASDWAHAISHDEIANVYRFDLVTERCVVDDDGARCERVAAQW